ncbi:MAG: exodeoxyribonuclease VII large subunit [Candidatus Binatus sp.]
MNGQLDLSLRGHRSGLITVSDLVRRVRDALDASLGEGWVVGEISNARLAPSNHFYFTLKDSRAAINVVMFKTAFQRMRFKVIDGMEVIVRGRVQVFEQRGTLQLYAEEMEPRGVGALQVAFEQLKRRLEAEGLFDRARKRAIPFLPRRIGIVTARGGAGLRDMLRILFDRFPSMQVIFRPARVQGDGSALEIADAIADLNRDGRAEVLIVGRGGGSLEDLWAFNEEIVARAIFRSVIPVISAVGHEVDYTIADFVADLRAPTPTAAAHMVVPSLAELQQRVEALGASLATVMERDLSSRRESIDDLSERIRHPGSIVAEARERVAGLELELADTAASRIDDGRRSIRELRLRLRSPDAMVRDLRVRTARLGSSLIRGAASALEARRALLGATAGRLDALSPLKVLDRGYAVVINQANSRAVLDAATVKFDDELDIRLAKGRLRARATGRSL